MKIEIPTWIKNNIFYAKITNTPNEVEKEKITKFSEPTVDVGGSFTGPPSFSVPTQLRKMISGFPFTYKIDGNADTDAKDKMVVWADEVEARILDAKTDLVANVDDYTGEEVRTL